MTHHLKTIDSERTSISSTDSKGTRQILVRSFIFSKSPNHVLPQKITPSHKTPNLISPTQDYIHLGKEFGLFDDHRLPRPIHVKRRISNDPSPIHFQRKILPPIKERQDYQVELDKNKRARSLDIQPQVQTQIKTKPFENSLRLIMDPRGALRAFSNVVESNRQSVNEEIKERRSVNCSSRVEIARSSGERVFFSNRHLKLNGIGKEENSEKPTAPTTKPQLETIKENTSNLSTAENRCKALQVNLQNIKNEKKSIDDMMTSMSGEMEMIKLTLEEELENLVEEFKLRVEEIKEEMIEYKLPDQQEHLRLTKLINNAISENKELTDNVNDARFRVERLEMELNEDDVLDHSKLLDASVLTKTIY